jgi:SsrA-binding protein
MPAEGEHIKIITQNKKARFDYMIEESYEAGVVLLGTEVKSIKNGKINLSDSYADFRNGELFLVNCNISQYPFSHHENHEPLRSRKLLMKKREMKRLSGKVIERGFTLVPLKVYLKRGYVKIEIGLAKGKKAFDKRETIKKRDQERDIKAHIKGRY